MPKKQNISTGQATMFSPTTKNGFDLFEASSAFQKAIRRGEEDLALYFMVEMWESGFGEYLWKRMKIIVSEDIGLAEPNMPANIHALYLMYNEQVAKKPVPGKNPERLFLTHAVLMLLRAKKSRLVDWTLVAKFRGHQDEKMTIPDWVFDKHTKKGRKMGRGWQHFFEEGTILENHEPQELEDERREAAMKQVMKRGFDTPLDEGGEETDDGLPIL